MISTQKRDLRWILWSTLLSLALALTMAIVQEVLVRSYEQSDFASCKHFLVRLLLAYLSYSVLVLILPKRILTAWIFLVAFFQTAILFYVSYFGKIPSLATLIGTCGEGFEVTDAILGLFPWKTFLLLLTVTGGLVLIQILRDRGPCSFKRRFGLAAAAAFTLTSVLGGLLLGNRARDSAFVYPLEPKVARFGVLPAWASEILFLRNNPIEKILEQARDMESEQSDLLDKEYRPEGTPRNIVVIQVESLDYAVLRLQIEGREVTPFLNSQADRSLDYRMWTMHDYGSATSDFVLLNGIPPTPGIFNYNIPGYEFPLSLPAFLKEQGYQTFAIHGVRGSFYNRLESYEKMNFDHLLFRQEIVEACEDNKGRLKRAFPSKSLKEIVSPAWLRDETVFECAQWVLEENHDRNNFLFLITATSHGPFTAHSRKEIFPNEHGIAQRYLNAVNNLDTELKNYYESLPEETLVIIYGDHTPQLSAPEFQSDVENGKQHVPLLIGIKGRNIDRFQCEESDPKEASLSLRDAYSYIKRVSQHPMEPDRNRIQANAKATKMRTVW